MWTHWQIRLEHVQGDKNRATLLVQGQWITGHVSMAIREVSY